MELRHLSYAVRVAQAGSFSRAAADLRMTQPSLSAAIAQLERELGAQLFERSTRGVSLTATGAYVVRQAQRMLRDVEGMRDTVRSMVSGTAGSLTLGLVPVLAWQFGPSVMRAFTAASPDVVLSLSERNVSEVIELLLEGVVDVGLVATASTAHLRDFHRDVLVVEHLGTVDLIAALPDRYASSPDPIRLADFAHEEIALPPPSARTYGLRAGLLRAFDLANLPTPRIRDVPSLFEAIPLAMAGIAVSIIPEGMRDAITSPELALRCIIDGPEPLDISLLHRPGRAVTPSVQKFALVAREVARAGGLAASSTQADDVEV
ncbi:LysR family transcriptional regulator [Luethyella okanaganae]|uniref:LysR family transcriptional regulator n=1 Tax=Luethyella okanaganae TaxID=69372 RepID=A0ABW1VG42_9MICO